MPTKSAWASKINWTQAVAVVLAMLTMFGISVPDEQKAQILAAITAVTGVVTWVLRTYFTNTTIKAAAPTSTAIGRVMTYAVGAPILAVLLLSGAGLSGCAGITSPILSPGVSAEVQAALSAAHAALPAAQVAVSTAEAFHLIPDSVAPTIDKLLADMPALLADADAAAKAGDAATVEDKVAAFTALAEQIAATIAQFHGDTADLHAHLARAHTASDRLHTARVRAGPVSLATPAGLTRPA